MAKSNIHEKKRELASQRLKRRLLTGGLVAGVLILTYFGMQFLGFSLSTFFRRAPQISTVVEGFLPPDFVDFTTYSKDNEIHGLSGLIASITNPGEMVSTIANAKAGRGNVILSAAITTLAAGFAGTVIGFPLALLFGVLGSERVTPFPFNFVFRGTMSTIRAIPAIIWTIIYIPVFGVDPVTGLLAISTDTVGNLGRLFTDELEEVEEGPIEAISSTGANGAQRVIFGMLSQVRNSFIAWTMYILEINTRIAITLGVLGVGGLGMYIDLKIASRTFSQAAAGIVTVVLIVITIEMLSSRVRARLRPEENDQRTIGEIVRNLFDPQKWLGVARRE
jgi:phosphonate transport system permease protein